MGDAPRNGEHSDGDLATATERRTFLTGNWIGEVPFAMGEERCETFCHFAKPMAGIRMERIVSYGSKSPPDFWYDQPEHEWVTVVTGEAILEFADRTERLGPSDWIFLPAHLRHRVAWTTPDQPTHWLAIFLTPTTDE